MSDGLPRDIYEPPHRLNDYDLSGATSPYLKLKY